MTSKSDFRIVYLGSPQFAVPPLQELLQQGYDIPLVITQPDRPKGRNRRLMPTDVRVAAEDMGLRVLAVENVNKPEVIAEIEAVRPDVLVVTAFGQLLGDKVLGIAPNGAINIHASLLPEYRGASPIHQALIDGRDVTGVSIMMVEKRLDAGAVLAKAECEIRPEDNTGALRERLAEIGAALLPQVLEDMQQGRLQPQVQDEAAATYAGKITADRELLDWSQSAVTLHNLVRGLTPDTSAYTCFYDGDEVRRLKVWKTLPAEADSDAANIAPGTVCRADKRGLWVKTGDGLLGLMIVQPPGKGQMDAAAWWRGRRDLQASGLRFLAVDEQ